MDNNLFRDGSDYWLVAENIKNLYLSDGSILNLCDFERVLDDLDIYAFRNWILGELVSGPIINRYTVTCTFLWPAEMMPDPRAGLRLLPFDCKVKFRKTKMKIPIKLQQPEDFIPGTHLARLIEKPIWLVEIEMPKNLINDIRTGSVELEDEDIDLKDLDAAYDKDIEKQEFKDPLQQTLGDQEQNVPV